MSTTPDIVRVFSQDDAYQAEFFPLLQREYNFNDGINFDIITNSSRLIALCGLAEASREGSALDGPVGEIFAEIWSMSRLMIEVSGIYPWLVCHPSELESLSEVVDPVIYGVWRILRRLCGIASESEGPDGQPRSFWDLFGSYIY
jgi:hypothetical protein